MNNNKMSVLKVLGLIAKTSANTDVNFYESSQKKEEQKKQKPNEDPASQEKSVEPVEEVKPVKSMEPDKTAEESTPQEESAPQQEGSVVQPKDPSTMNAEQSVMSSFMEQVSPELLQSAANGDQNAILAIIDTSSRIVSGTGIEDASGNFQQEGSGSPQQQPPQMQQQAMGNFQQEDPGNFQQQPPQPPQQAMGQFQPSPNPGYGVPSNEQNPREVAGTSNEMMYQNAQQPVEQQIAQKEIAEPSQQNMQSDQLPQKSMNTKVVGDANDGGQMSVAPSAAEGVKLEKAKQGLISLINMIQQQ